MPSIILLENVKLKKRLNKKIITREPNDCKLKDLKDNLRREQLDKILTGHNPNTDYNLLVGKIQTAMDQYIPEKEINIPAKQFICEPWITKGLIKCGRKQQLLYKKALKVGNEGALIKYKEYHSALQKIKRRSKKDYFAKKCFEFKSNTKNLWRTINNVIKSNSDKSCIIDYLKIDNIKQTEAQKIANEFGSFFLTVGEKIASKSGNSKLKLSDYLNKITRQRNSVFLTPCTEDEIKNLIKGLPNKYSSGRDNITNIILKEIKLEIAAPLNIIFNSSLSTGIFPNQMKLADVVPLYKNGHHFLVTNY